MKLNRIFYFVGAMFFLFIVNTVIDVCYFQYYSTEKTTVIVIVFTVIVVILSVLTTKINNNKEKIFSLLKPFKTEKIFLKERGEFLVLKQYTKDQQWSKDVLFFQIGFNAIGVKALGKNKRVFKMKEIESPSEKKFLWYIKKYIRE